MLNNIMNYIPARFPVITSIIAGTMFYWPGFWEAKKQYTPSGSIGNMIALFITVITGSIFLLLFNAFLFGWYLLLTKLQSKEKINLVETKKLVYFIALTQPLLFVPLLITSLFGGQFCLNLYLFLCAFALGIVLFRIILTMLFLRAQIKFSPSYCVIGIVPFLDCWFVLYTVLKS